MVSCRALVAYLLLLAGARCALSLSTNCYPECNSEKLNEVQWSVSGTSLSVTIEPACTIKEATAFFQYTARKLPNTAPFNQGVDPDPTPAQAFKLMSMHGERSSITLGPILGGNTGEAVIIEVQLYRQNPIDTHLVSKSGVKKSDFELNCCREASKVLLSYEVDPGYGYDPHYPNFRPEMLGQEYCVDNLDLSVYSTPKCTHPDIGPAWTPSLQYHVCVDTDRLRRVNYFFCQRQYCADPFVTGTADDCGPEHCIGGDQCDCTKCACTGGATSCGGIHPSLGGLGSNGQYEWKTGGKFWEVGVKGHCVDKTDTLTHLPRLPGGAEFKLRAYFGPAPRGESAYLDEITVSVDQIPCTSVMFACTEHEFAMRINVHVPNIADMSAVQFFYKVSSEESSSDYSVTSAMPYKTYADLPEAHETNTQAYQLSNFAFVHDKPTLFYYQKFPLGRFRVQVNRMVPAHVTTKRYATTNYCKADNGCGSPLLECNNALPRACAHVSGADPQAQFTFDENVPEAWTVVTNPDCQCPAMTLGAKQLMAGEVEFNFDDAFRCPYTYRICDITTTTDDVCKTGRVTDTDSLCTAHEVADINTRFDVSQELAGTIKEYEARFRDSSNEEYERLLTVESVVAFRTDLTVTVSTRTGAAVRDRYVHYRFADSAPFDNGTVGSAQTSDLGTVPFSLLADVKNMVRTDAQLHKLQSHIVELRFDGGSRHAPNLYSECLDKLKLVHRLDETRSHLPPFVPGVGVVSKCTTATKCAEFHGDCDGSDAVCADGTRCVRDIGLHYQHASFAKPPSSLEQARIDVCLNDTLGTPEFCANKVDGCVSGQGHCKKSAECRGGLVCRSGVGLLFGYSNETNVCVCTTDDECKTAAAKCRQGVCTCTSDADCHTTDETCLAGDCVASPIPFTPLRKRDVESRRDKMRQWKRSLIDKSDAGALATYLCDTAGLCPRESNSCPGAGGRLRKAHEELIFELDIEAEVDGTWFCASIDTHEYCWATELGGGETCATYSLCVNDYDNNCPADHYCAPFANTTDLSVGVCVPPSTGAPCLVAEAPLAACGSASLRCVAIDGDASGEGTCEWIGHERFCSSSTCAAFEGHCTNATQCAADLDCVASTFADFYDFAPPPDGNVNLPSDVSLCLPTCDANGLCGEPHDGRLCARSVGRALASLSEAAAALYGSFSAGQLLCMDTAHADYCFNAGTTCDIGGRCELRSDCAVALSCLDNRCVEAYRTDACSAASPCGEYSGHCHNDTECAGFLECREGLFSLVFGSDAFVANGSLSSASDVGLCVVSNARCEATGVCGRPYSVANGDVRCLSELYVAVRLSSEMEDELALDAGVYCMNESHARFCLNNAEISCSVGEPCFNRDDCLESLQCSSSGTCIGVGHPEYCELASCGIGEGPCDSHAQCDDGLQCHKRLAEYYLEEPVDGKRALGIDDGICVHTDQFGGYNHCQLTGICSLADAGGGCHEAGFAAIEVRTKVRGVLLDVDSLLSPAKRQPSSDPLVYCVRTDHVDFPLYTGVPGGSFCKFKTLVCDDELKCIGDFCLAASHQDAGYCLSLCGAYEGHCESDSQCETGLTCVPNTGGLAGLPDTYSLCLDLQCVHDVEVAHGSEVGHTITDLSSVALRGHVRFKEKLGAASCVPFDVEVSAYLYDTETRSRGAVLDDVLVDSKGRYSLAVPPSTSVLVEYARTSAPNYRFDSNTVSVESGTGTEVRLDDVLVLDADELIIAVEGGPCQYAVTLEITSAVFEADNCNDGKPFEALAGTQDVDSLDYVHFVFDQVPPVTFLLSKLIVDNVDVSESVKRQGARTYDLRLPVVPLKNTQATTQGDGAPDTTTASLGLKPERSLSNDVLLAIAFDGSFDDAGGHRHSIEAGDADEFDALLVNNEVESDVFAGTGALRVSDASKKGVTLGPNYFVELGSSESGGGTISMWVRADVAPGPALAAVVVDLMSAHATVDGEQNGYKLQLRGRADEAVVAVTLRDQQDVLEVNFPLGRSAWRHVALMYTVSAMNANEKNVTLCVDGTCAPSRTATFSETLHGAGLAACAARAVPWQCAEETKIGVLRSGLSDTNHRVLIDDVALWSRALTSSDVRFVWGSGLDGFALSGDAPGGLLISPSAPFVFRTAPQLYVALDRARYYAPLKTPTSEGATHGPATVFGTDRRTACDVSEMGVRQVHRVQAGAAVTFSASAREIYKHPDFEPNQLCPMVSGEVFVTAGFTGQCTVDPQRVKASTDEQLVCGGQLLPTSFGQIAFHGVVRAPNMIPLEDAENLEVDSKRDLREAGDHDPYLGNLRFGFRATAADDYTVIDVWFAIEGITEPDAPSVFSVPVGDVPLLRLYRPPGDESQSLLSRDWARGITLSVMSAESDTVLAQAGASVGVGGGVEAEQCSGTGYELCLRLGFWVSVEAEFEYTYAGITETEVTLEKLWSREQQLEFATGVDELALGKEGDLVVTLGFDILVSQSFKVEFDTATCTIKQQYFPSWKPQPNAKLSESLQVYTFLQIPYQVLSWIELRENLLRECPIEAGIADKCLDSTFGRKLSNAKQGAKRWSAIMANMIDVRDGARLMSDLARDEDYDEEAERAVYELPKAKTDAQLKQQTNPINLWHLPQVISGVKGDKADALLASGVALRERLFDSSGDVSQCSVDDDELPGTTCPELLAKTNTTFGGLPTQAVTKVHFHGGTSTSYVSVASITASDEYAFAFTEEHSWEGDLTVSVEAMVFVVGLDASVHVGGGRAISSSSGKSYGSESMDATTVSFVLGDDDPGDSFGVNVFADPVYGTPVFVTTGGYSRCPAEPDTNPREAVDVYPRSKQVIVLRDPDEEAVLDFRARLKTIRAQDADGGAFDYYLQVFDDSDLTVTYKGEMMDIGSRHELQVDSSEYRRIGPIRVRRGAGYTYKGVSIRIISACDDDGRGVDASVFYDISWSPRCAPISIDTARTSLPSTNLFGATHRRASFVINRATDDFRVPLKNPDPLAVWQRQGSFRVGVEARRVGEQSTWEEVPTALSDQSVAAQRKLHFCDPQEENVFDSASCLAACAVEVDPDTLEQSKPACCQNAYTTCDPSATAPKLCCGAQNAAAQASAQFTMECVDDGQMSMPARKHCVLVDALASAGSGQPLLFDHSDVWLHAGADWLLSGDEAEYEGEVEIRVFSACNELAVPRYFYSEPLRGRVDRVAPRAFGGMQEPSDGVWWPGDTIAVRFVEEIDCRPPHQFTVNVESALTSGGDTTDLSNSIDAVCRHDAIEIRFDEAFLQTAADARHFTVTVDNVRDLALNVQDGAVSWSFVMGDFDPSQVSVSLQDVRVEHAANEPLDTDAIVTALFGAGSPLDKVTVKFTDTRRKRGAGAAEATNTTLGAGARETVVGSVVIGASAHSLELARTAYARLSAARASENGVLRGASEDNLEQLVFAKSSWRMSLHTAQARKPANAQLWAERFGDERPSATLLQVAVVIQASVILLMLCVFVVSRRRRSLVRNVDSEKLTASVVGAAIGRRHSLRPHPPTRTVPFLVTLLASACIVCIFVAPVRASEFETECGTEAQPIALCKQCQLCESSGNWQLATTSQALTDHLNANAACISVTSSFEHGTPSDVHTDLSLARCLRIEQGASLSVANNGAVGNTVGRRPNVGRTGSAGFCLHVTDSSEFVTTRTLTIGATTQGTVAAGVFVDGASSVNISSLYGESGAWRLVAAGGSTVTIDNTMSLLSMTSEANHVGVAVCVRGGSALLVGSAAAARTAGSSNHLSVTGASSEAIFTGRGLKLRGGDDRVFVGVDAALTTDLLDVGAGADFVHVDGTFNGDADVADADNKADVCTSHVEHAVGGGNAQLVLHCPTQAPTNAPTAAPKRLPTRVPTRMPTEAPTDAPQHAPTKAPTDAPTEAPTTEPTASTCYESALYALQAPYVLLLDELTVQEPVVNSGTSGGTATRIGTWTDADLGAPAEVGASSYAFSSSPRRALYLTDISVAQVRASVSVVFWVRRPAALLSSDETVVMLGDMHSSTKSVREDFGLYYDTSTQVHFVVSTVGFDIGTTASATLNDGGWHLVALTSSQANGSKLYLDGSPAYSTAYPLYLSTSGLELVVGGQGAGTPTADSKLEFNGYIDGVALFTDVELNVAQISGLSC